MNKQSGFTLIELVLVLQWEEDWQKHYLVEMDIDTTQIIVATVLRVVTTIRIVTINLMVGLYLVRDSVL